MIGGNPPSTYLARLQKSAGIDENRMNDILRSHVIAPEAIRADDFESFWKRREESLLSRIEKAIGKTVARDQAVGEPEPDVDEPDDENVADAT